MSEYNACHVAPIEKPLDKNALVQANATLLGISGIGCPNCALRVQNGLLRIKGVLYADVSSQSKVAAVAYDPKLVSPTNLVTAVANSGNDGRHEYRACVLRTMPADEAVTLI